MGEKILEPLKLGEYRRISRMVRHHHEAFDGSGYPDRLKGEGIPLGARIWPWPTRLTPSFPTGLTAGAAP